MNTTNTPLTTAASTPQTDATARLPVLTAVDNRDSTIRLSADVVIVGSGAGGAVAAYELAKEGRRVVVLEAGPYIESSEFSERYPEMVSKLFQDNGGQVNADGDMAVLQGACVGGSTVVNAAACFRTPGHILEDWQRDFGLTDITEERLAPLFDTVEKNLSVHVNQPHEINNNSRIIEQGCKKLNVSTRPLARNTKDCALSGFCLAGCASDRKQSMLVTYLPWAMHYGAQVLANTRVDTIEQRGGRASGVSATMTDPESGRVTPVRVDAKVVLAAAGAVQTPLLLLRSGLGDANGMVGKNFACHPSLAIFADFDEDIYGWRGATMGSYCDEWEPSEKGGFIFEFALTGADFAATAAPGIADRHLAFMSRLKNLAGMISLIHDENVGTVSYDKHGRKRIDYRLAEKDHPKIRQCLEKSAEIYFAAGANEVYLPTLSPVTIRDPKEIKKKVADVDLGPRSLFLSSYHPQGTARMGVNPANSVVNAIGESHDLPGLFVCDASLFPTSIMVNPQITVYTLASYVAQQINRHADRYF